MKRQREQEAAEANQKRESEQKAQKLQVCQCCCLFQNWRRNYVKQAENTRLKREMASLQVYLYLTTIEMENCQCALSAGEECLG